MALGTTARGLPNVLFVGVPVVLSWRSRLPMTRPVHEDDIQLPPLTMRLLLWIGASVRRECWYRALYLLNRIESSKHAAGIANESKRCRRVAYSYGIHELY